MPQGKFAQFVEGNDPAPAKGRFASFVESSDSGAQSSTPSTRQVAKPRTTSRTAPPPQPVSPSRFEQPPIGQALLEESKSFERSPRVAETERARREFESLPVTERMGRRVKTGYNQGAQFAADTVSRIGDIAGGAIEGNFEPLREQIEGAKQGLRVGAARLMPAIVSPKVAPEAQAALARNEQSRDSRRRAEGDLTYIGGQEESRRLQAEAEADPSLAGGVTRGAVSGAISSLPYLAASVAGGGVPALAGVAAATSDYTRPGEAAANIAGSVLPVKAARAAGPLVERAASAVPRAAPAIRGAAPVGIGAGTNVAQSVAMGKTDPGELAEQATIGALMSGTDAYQAARRGPVGLERGTRTGLAEPPVSNVNPVDTAGPVSEQPSTFPRMMGPPARRVATPKETRITPKLNTEQARADLAEVTKQARTDPQAAAEVPEYRDLAQAMGPGQLSDKAVAESAARAEARQAERRARVGTQNRGTGAPNIPAQMEMLEPPLPPRRRGLSGVGAPNIPEQMDVTPPLANQPGTRPPVRGTGLGAPNIPDAIAPELLNQPEQLRQRPRGLGIGEPNIPEMGKEATPPAPPYRRRGTGLGTPNIPESMISTPQIGESPATDVPRRKAAQTSETAPRSQPEIPPTPDVSVEPPPRRRPSVEQSVIQSGRPTPRTLPAPPPRRMNIPVNNPTPEPATSPQRAQAAQVKNVIPEVKRTPDLQKQLDFIARAEPAQLDRAIVNLEGALPGMAPDVLARRQEILKAANVRRAQLVAEGKLPPKYGEPAPADHLGKSDLIAQPELTEEGKAARMAEKREVADAAREGRIERNARIIEAQAPSKAVTPPTATKEPYATHQDFGPVTKAESQSGVGRGKVRVVGEDGAEHIINKRGRNQRAIISKEKGAETGTATPKPVEPSISEAPTPAPASKQNMPERDTGWLGSVPEHNRERVLMAMRQIDNRVQGNRQRSKSLSPTQGMIGVGNNDIMPRLQADAMSTFLREINKGSTPDTALDVAKAEARQLIKSWNERESKGRMAVERKSELHHWEGALDAELESAWRTLRQDSERAAPAAPEQATPSAVEAAPRRVARASTKANTDADVIRTMAETKPSVKTGGLVPIAEMRAKSKLKGDAFDAAVLDLARKGIIALHRHDFPTSLKPEELAGMIREKAPDAGTQGTGYDYYVGAAFRDTNNPTIAEALKAKPKRGRVSVGPIEESKGGTILGAGLGGLQSNPFKRQQKPQVQPSARLRQRGVVQAGGVQGKRIPAPVEPKTFGQRFKEEAISVVNAPRSIQSSVDISAPLRQGAVLTLPPTQWGRAARAGVQMFKSFSTKQHEQFTDDLNNRPDAQDARDAGLYLASDSKKTGLAQREEAFMSRLTENLPIIKHSGQAYAGYLDALRSSTFTKYKNVIDRANLSPEETAKGYKAAADWINTATGRGSLGSTIDSAMPALSTVLFSPRFVASRLQLLNPVTYAKNATSPGKRAVLKQQLGDAVQFAAVVSATLGLAKAAGAEVGTDPESPDFLKIKAGKTTYDFLAGIQQPMRLFYRIAEDVRRAAKGEPAKRGADTLSLLGRFGRSKLAPTPSFGVDMVARKDFIGRPFEVKRAIVDRVAPMFLKDAIEAYQQEGLAGTAKVLPGALGVGVQSKRESAAPRTRSDRNRRRRRGRDRRER